MNTLFPEPEPDILEPKEDAPLADRMRPRTLEEFVGQEGILSPGSLLRRAIEKDELRSLILWGPPGTGKTTLATVIARRTRARFVSYSAVLSGVKEIREVMKKARQTRASDRRKTFNCPYSIMTRLKPTPKSASLTSWWMYSQSGETRRA